MKKQRLINPGYTLIEMVVALAVAAVLFASMIAVIAPVYRIYARTRERSDAQLVAGSVLDSIRATCSNARTITAEDGRLTLNGSMVFFVQDGYLYFDEDTEEAPEADTVLATGVYNGKTITAFSCTQIEANRLVNLSITVSGGDGASCTLSATIGSMREVINTPSPSPAPTP